MRLWLGALLLLLSACSSGGPDRLIIAARDQILGRTTPTEEATPLSRARIDALGVALLRVSVPSSGQNHVVVASQIRGGKVTYLGPEQRTVLMQGGLVAVTRGLGTDMSPPIVSADDPLVRATPLAAWPEDVTRIYQISERGVTLLRIEMTCRFSVGPVRKLEITERFYTVRAVEETCSDGNDLSFTNAHMVEPGSGFIWRSSQWTGPIQGLLTYEVLEPFE